MDIKELKIRPQKTALRAYRVHFILENLKAMKGKEIAKHLGIPPSSVSKLLRSLGIPDRRRVIDPENLRSYLQTNAKVKTIAEMARELEIGKRTIAEYLKTFGISARKSRRRSITE